MKITDQTTKVKSYTEISRACLKSGQTSLLRVWYWLRHKDIQGCGWISYDRFVSALGEIGISSKRAAQLYKKGMNIWWDSAGYGVALCGLARIVYSFDLDNEGDLVVLPEDYFNSISTFNAYIYVSFFAKASWREYEVESNHVVAVGGKTISRDRLEEIFGLSKRTQRRYEKLARVIVQEEFAYFQITDENIGELPLTEGALEGKNNCGVWYEDVNGDGIPELVRQLPNTYTTQLEYQPHHKKVHNSDKSGGLSISGKASLRYTRLYYQNCEQAGKAITHKRVHGGGLYLRINGIFSHGRNKEKKGGLHEYIICK